MRYVAIARIGHPYLIVWFFCNFRLWYVVMRVDTFWYDSLRLGAIWSRWWHGLPRPVLSFRYDYIRSDKIVPIESTMGCQSHTIITIGVPDFGRCGTRIYIYVLMLSSRTDTLCCDRIRLWSRCLSWLSRFELRLDSKGIYTARLTVSFDIFYKVNISTHNSW